MKTSTRFFFCLFEYDEGREEEEKEGRKGDGESEKGNFGFFLLLKISVTFSSFN